MCETSAGFLEAVFGKQSPILALLWWHSWYGTACQGDIASPASSRSSWLPLVWAWNGRRDWSSISACSKGLMKTSPPSACGRLRASFPSHFLAKSENQAMKPRALCHHQHTTGVLAGSPFETLSNFYKYQKVQSWEPKALSVQRNQLAQLLKTTLFHKSYSRRALRQTAL